MSKDGVAGHTIPIILTEQVTEHNAPLGSLSVRRILCANSATMLSSHLRI